ncbi:hypothetical protein [Oceanobacillus sojae]|uniref:hypothetical protein n=1 Tax=Oceanobacillus sojae TaxID=582851 RepID=UPI0021A93AB8|nr:hypothetical protein [Oceanobacillus sojae]MCT1901181.1 hypothetical protein [Oceanobacillus sojae]
MNHHDKDFTKELSKLKINRSLDTEKKERMKMTLSKHAEKKRAQQQRKSKVKHAFIWLSTAAVIVLCGVFIFQIIKNDSVTAPDTEQEDTTAYLELDPDMQHDIYPVDPKDMGGVESEKRSDFEDSTSVFSIRENGTEADTILLEGTEEEVTVHNFTIEPYNIQFQIEEFLSNYETTEDEVRFYSNAENAEVRIHVAESATIEDTITDVQESYDHKFDDAEEPQALPADENAFEGVTQHISDPPEGYYLYQVDNNVLIIQYDYDIEAADGVSPRLELLRNSIQ